MIEGRQLKVMDQRLPSHEWLQDTNLKLASAGFPPEKRQYQAFRMWCTESGQPMGFPYQLCLLTIINSERLNSAISLRLGNFLKRVATQPL
jgi:hypothetical protein